MHDHLHYENATNTNNLVETNIIVQSSEKPTGGVGIAKEATLSGKSNVAAASTTRPAVCKEEQGAILLWPRRCEIRNAL